MGLWVQCVGVRAAELPPSVCELAGREQYGLPQTHAEGWVWASLRGEEESGSFLELGELDALVVRAAGEAGGAVVGYSVHDSDSVYLVGADAVGVRFGCVVNPRDWEGAPPPLDAAAVVAWAREHAPRAPSEDEVRATLGRNYVFAEEGLDVLLARMGLVPEFDFDAVETLTDAQLDDDVDEREDGDGDEGPDTADFEEQVREYAVVADAPARELEGRVAVARARSFSAWFIAGEEERDVVGVPGFAPQRTLSLYVVLDSERRPRLWAWFHAHEWEDLEEIAEDMALSGLRLEEWRDVPPDASRNLAAIVAALAPL